jgi:RNA polymerase sigma factor (sigma-70 family)
MPNRSESARGSPAGRRRTDVALARAAHDRDERALRTIIERLAVRFRAIAWHMTWDYHETEDLCQEALAKVTAPAVLGRYRGDGPLDAYLTNVGVRAMISRQRTKSVWRGKVELAPAPGHVGRHESTEGVVLNRSLAGPLRRALERLPERARLTVLLIVVGDLSYEETAKTLGLKLGTVKSVYHRARGELRVQLAAEGFARIEEAAP